MSVISPSLFTFGSSKNKKRRERINIFVLLILHGVFLYAYFLVNINFSREHSINLTSTNQTISAFKKFLVFFLYCVWSCTALFCIKDGFGSSSRDCHFPWLCRFDQPASVAFPCDAHHRPGAYECVTLVSVRVPRAIWGSEVRGSNCASVWDIPTANVSKSVVITFRDSLAKLM